MSLSLYPCVWLWHIRRGRSLSVLVIKVFQGLRVENGQQILLHAFLLSMGACREQTPRKNSFVRMKKGFILFCAIVCGMQAMATNLVVETKSGSALSNDIAIVGKWVFMGNNLILMGKDGNILGFESLSNIRKILFSPSEPDVPSGMADVPTNQAYIVYPNPTQDILFVKVVSVSILFRIFSMDGLEVLSTVGSQVQVSQLPNATYLLQIGTQVARFIKQ